MTLPYGTKDASYQAAGGADGVRKLVDDFYDAMESLPEASHILGMHPADLAVSRDKLVVFLCGWLGGPKRYAETYGPISIPGAHQHLKIGFEERDAWLLCMQTAVDKQPYSDEFKAYFMQQIAFPAERVRVTSRD